MYDFDLLGIIDMFARAGGGGSSSGSGSDGSGGEILALLGYFPSYYLGKIVKKLLPRRAEIIVSASFATLFSIMLLVIGLLGGSLGIVFAICVIVGVWSGWSAAFFGVWDKLRERAKKTKNRIDIAEQADAAWNEEMMLQIVESTFYQFQSDWSNHNIASIQTYLEPSYARHISLQLQILTELGRRNQMSDVSIQQMHIIDMHDSVDNTVDQFTVAIEAKATDILLDTKTNTQLYVDRRAFTEYWVFLRGVDTTTPWILKSIRQTTEHASSYEKSMQKFAHENHMYYSLDMGWLYMPIAGILAKRGKLGQSDINNHVVGTYHDRLVQLYTFTPVIDRSNTSAWNYLMLQVSLPKSYSGIIVQPGKKLLSNTFIKPPKDYTKHEFEWADFNKRYDVHATDADRIATFELLNPGFMEYLYDNDPGIGIEVADNVLYLFKPLGSISGKRVKQTEYQTMLTIALKAFKELQL